jgi:hypothetical protein
MSLRVRSTGLVRAPRFLLYSESSPSEMTRMRRLTFGRACGLPSGDRTATRSFAAVLIPSSRSVEPFS